MAKCKIATNKTNDFPVEKAEDTVMFQTEPSVNITGFWFTRHREPCPPPPGFSNATISFEYDGSAIPAGYGFHFHTDGPPRGDGTGIIRNK